MIKDTKSVRVTQKAVVLRNDGKLLAIRRSKTAPSHALEWDLPGGQLEYGEDPYVGIAREIKEESSIEVRSIKPFDVFGHENPVGFWVTVAYVCEALSDEVILSFEHVEYKWVTGEEFLKLQATPKNVRFVSNFLKIK